MIYGYIYVTENLINGKKYIGQHIGNAYDKKYIGSGKYLWRSIRKYGIENFKNTIVDIAYSKEQLNELEKWYINKFNATKSNKFYNIHIGGTGGNMIAGLTEEEKKETRRKISLSMKGKMLGKKHPMYGKNHSESTRRKMSEAKQNISESTRRKISENHARVMLGRTGENHPKSKQAIIIFDGAEIIRNTSGEIANYLRNEKGIKACIVQWFTFDKNGVPRIPKKWLPRIDFVGYIDSYDYQMYKEFGYWQIDGYIDEEVA